MAPFAVKFTDQSTGVPTSLRWDMNNDGVVDGTTKNPTYTYSSAGTYSVTLTAQKPGSIHSITRSAYITVIDPIVSRFRADVTSGKAPLTVRFSDMSYGTPTSWEWDFNNDGVVDSTTQHPSFTFTQSGNYTVKLTIGKLGFTASETKTNFIMVGPGTPVETTGKSERQVLVYPSPTTSWTNIKLENFDDKKAKIEIVDIHGVVVANYNLSGEEVLMLDCSVFARGLYYVKTICNNQVFTNTLILQ
jgi:PKD repeat protein